MRRILTLAMCAVLLFGMIFAFGTAHAAENHSEAEILDRIADSWIATCTKNIDGCVQGMAVYCLGELEPECKLQIQAAVKELNEGVSDGYIETQFLRVKLNVDEFCDAIDSTEIKNDIETYMNTSAAEVMTKEWEEHLKAELNIKDTVKTGEIAKDVDVVDIIKENYAFLIGTESCTEAIDYFTLALDADDLAVKRLFMLKGASLATFGCEMSIGKADEVVKGTALNKKPEDIMVDIAEAGIDVVSEIVPEIGIFYDTLTITADVGIKLLSMQGKLDALSGYMLNPDSIEEDKSAYYQALSNQYGKFTYSINDFEITMDEYKGYLDTGDAYSIVEVPEALEEFPDFPVVAFEGTFAKDLDITEISIPSTLETRGLVAVIDNCDKLKTVKYNAINCKGWYLHYFIENCDSEFQVTFGEGVEVIPERFIANSGLSSITFPEGITTMYAGALVNCQNLKMVTIPSTVKKFEIPFNERAVVDNCTNLEEVSYNAVNAEAGYYNAVFADCGNNAEQMQLNIGENVTIIPTTFLSNCGVKELVFPEGVTQIREQAVYGCQKLESITIPSTVTSFNKNIAGDYVFSACNNLKIVNYNATNVAGEIGAFVFCDIESEFTINFGPQIETIPQNFISNCGLTAIAFPESVKAIYNNCLVNCDNLKTVTVPSTVETFEYNFLDGCGSIENIYFNANCATYPHAAMISNCGDFTDPIMTVQLGENVTTVPQHFIEECAIREFVYPEGVKIINEYSLVNCGALEKVVIPSTVEQIGYKAIGDCSGLKTIEYNALNAEKLGNGYVFYKCGDPAGMEICFGKNVKTLPPEFMHDCSVLRLTFPATITRIPERAFFGCSNLSVLTIPQNITDIDKEAFDGSTGLTEIYFHAAAMNDLKYNNSVFANAGENTEGITVIIGNEVTKIPAHLFCPYYSFNGDPKITDVVFAEESACTSIGNNAFSYCASLPAIEIPDSVTVISEEAFYKCSGLYNVKIGGKVETIGKSAFASCKSLQSVGIPDSVTTLGNGAFADCNALAAVTIGDGVTKIPNEAFKNCAALTSVSFGKSVTQIAGQAFRDCTALTHIAIPDSIDRIDYYAFSGCTALSSIIIPDSVTAIGHNAFLDCDSLANVIYCGTEHQWNKISIYKDGNEDLVYTPRRYHNWVGIPGTADRNCSICGCPECDTLGHAYEAVVTAPTCTEQGYTTYSCDCGDSYTADEEKALGHTNRYVNNGNGTHDATCSACRKNTANDEMHTYTDGVCVCGAEEPVELIEWYGTSSTLGGKLSLNFYIESAKLSGLTDGYAVLTRSYADGRAEDMVTIDQVDWAKNGSYFMFTYSDIAAKEMGDVVTAVIYNADGTAVTAVKEDSVATWAMRVLESDRYKNDKVTCTMQVDLLNYGAAAQTYWHYNEKNLVNATLTAEQKALATADAETVESIKDGQNLYGTSLVLEDEILLKFYFDVAYAEGMTAKATFTDHTGEEITVELQASKNSNLTQVLVTGMAIADYKAAVTCELYDAEGNVVAWGVDGMASNISRQVEPAWLVVCEAIMKLGASSYAYFHK